MTSENGLLIYIKGTSIESGTRWITTFLEGLSVTHAEDGFVALTGTSCGEHETVTLTEGPDGSLQVVASCDHLPWKHSTDFARVAFQYFGTEVESVPPDQHFPGEMLVINDSGETILDRDEQ